MELDLEHPKTLCDKLNWLKINDRKALYTRMVDKYEAKKLAEERLGKKHVIPLLGVWQNFDDIDFDALPEQFVLKNTHDSGGQVICKSKRALDRKSAKSMLERSLRANYFRLSREWPYKNVHRRIIAEKYVDSLGKEDSIEYKVTCFNGKVAVITICRGIAHASFDVRTNDHFDVEFNRLPWYVNYKNCGREIERPEQWDELIRFSELMAKDTIYVRVDFYVIDGTVYFGECTFYTWGGIMNFNPPEWDEILGGNLRLPIDTNETVRITLPGLEG